MSEEILDPLRQLTETQKKTATTTGTQADNDNIHVKNDFHQDYS